MAATTPSSSALTRYPRWAFALVGLTAAYATYTLWSIHAANEHTHGSNNTRLQRRGAVRQPRRRSPQHEQQLLANRADSSANEAGTSPFGTITASVNDREQIYQIGPNPPTLQDLRTDFHIRDATLRRIHAEMQHVLLDIIIDRLVEPDSDNLLTPAGPVYTSLMPLIEPLRERNIDDLLANIDLLSRGHGPSSSGNDSDRIWRYDQGNVALAFARRCGVDVETARSNMMAANSNNRMLDNLLDGDDPDIAETVVSSSDAHNTPEPGQGIKGLLYAIAEEQAHRTAYTHRGTRCDSCGEFPIKGVRWHCINCADYDLCSPCESLSPSVHPRTHVFAKIKIPISTLAQPHQVHDLWYPGDPLRHWPTLKVSLRKELASKTGFEDVVLEALYEQFTCLANVAYPEDPADIKAAIDRRAFNKAMSSDKWPAPLEPNFLFDRMFSFYDTDNNSLVGFEEFVSGLAYLRQPGEIRGMKKDLKRILKGYDVDGDGLLSRADFVRMMSAKYAVQRHIIRDVVAAEEAEIVAHTGDVVRSSQPISAAFTGEDVPYGERRIPDMKRMDAFGDMQVAVEGQLARATLAEEGQVWDEQTVNAAARRYDRVEDLPLCNAMGELEGADAEEMRNRYSRVDHVPVPVTNGTNGDESEGREGGDGAEHNQVRTYLVETDPRSTRGRRDLEPAEERWTTDLNDIVSGGASGSSTPGVQHGHTSENDRNGNDGPPFPDFILERGRSYPIPENELSFGRDVLYQVIQESINELLDPLFAEKERLAYEVRATRNDRQKFRSQIDEFKKRREEMRARAEADPLLGIAQGVVDDDTGSHQSQTLTVNGMGELGLVRNGGAYPRPGQDASQWDADVVPRAGSDDDEDPTSLFVGHSEPLRSAAPSPTASQSVLGGRSSPPILNLNSESQPPPAVDGGEDIATTIRQQLREEARALPTDEDGLADLEFNIRQQPLEDLLESAGYSIASPAESPAVSTDESTEPSFDAPAHDQEHEESDPPRRESVATSTTSVRAQSAMSEVSEQSTQDSFSSQLDQNPGSADLDEEEEESSMHLSPSSPPTPAAIPHTSNSAFLASIPNTIPASSSILATDDDATPEYPRSRGNHENENEDGSVNDDGQESGGTPSQSILEYWALLDEEEKSILKRQGPGRLTFEEVQEICERLQRDGIGGGGSGLLGLIEGWLEWAGF